MPFNGSGTFTIVNTFVPNTTILSAAVNQNFSDIATGLSDVLTRDGQAGMTAAFKAISGALATPSITFTSDPTSGLFLSAAGVPGFVAHSLGMLLNTNIFSATSAVVSAAGSGYAVGDTITETGGTAITQPVFTVATLSGTGVATVTVGYPGFYTAKPSNPVAQGSTSGVGTGCTLTITYNDPVSSDYRAIFTDQAGALLWQKLGSSSFVSGLMAKANGLDFATGIGATNIATVLSASFLIPPGGILSPVASTTDPIPTADQTAVTRVYWTPFNGNSTPIYNGANLINTTSGQIFCDLTAGAQVLNGIYDIYKFLVAGVVTLGFSPSWSAGTSGSVTAGSCARGTGAGGTAFTYFSGVPTNAVAMTLNNGATTYNILINQATYLGSVYINAVAGQYNCFRQWGQSRVYGLWNLYNQRDIELVAGVASLGPWSAPATWRQSNADATAKVISFMGLVTGLIDASFTQKIGVLPTASSTSTVQISMGFNSTTSPLPASTAEVNFGNTTAGTITNISTVTSVASFTPPLGINNINCIEQAPAAAATSNLFGSQTFMQLRTVYRG